MSIGAAKAMVENNNDNNKVNVVVLLISNNVVMDIGIHVETSIII